MDGKAKIIDEIAAVLRECPHSFAVGLLRSLQEQWPELRQMGEESRPFEESTFISDDDSLN